MSCVNAVPVPDDLALRRGLRARRMQGPKRFVRTVGWSRQVTRGHAGLVAGDQGVTTWEW